MKEKRKSFRFENHKTARYSSSERRGVWQECSIINFSRQGVLVLLRENITADTNIVLELAVPGEDDPLCFRGSVQWLEKRDSDYCAGIALNTLLDDEAFRKCFIGYRLDLGTQRREVTSDGNAPKNEVVSSLGGQGCSVRFPGKHLVSLKGVSVSLLFLLLIVVFPLLFLNVRGYSSSSPYKGDTQKKVVAADRKRETHGEAPISGKDGPPTAVFKEEGGSLYSLALKYYQRANETIFDLILHANPAITDVRKIGDKQKITLPVITPASYVQKVSDGGYRVYIGTFETFESAATYSKKISTTKKLLAIESHDFSSQDTWYRLTLGDYRNKEEALAAAVLLKEKAVIYIPPASR
jgi:phage tail protein X